MFPKGLKEAKLYCAFPKPSVDCVSYSEIKLLPPTENDPEFVEAVVLPVVELVVEDEVLLVVEEVVELVVLPDVVLLVVEEVVELVVLPDVVLPEVVLVVEEVEELVVVPEVVEDVVLLVVDDVVVPSLFSSLSFSHEFKKAKLNAKPVTIKIFFFI